MQLISYIDKNVDKKPYLSNHLKILEYTNDNFNL